MPSPARRRGVPFWKEREQALTTKIDRLEADATTHMKAQRHARTLGPCTGCRADLVRPVHTVLARRGYWHLECWRAATARQRTKGPTCAPADTRIEPLSIAPSPGDTQTIHAHAPEGQRGLNRRVGDKPATTQRMSAAPVLMAPETPERSDGWGAFVAPSSDAPTPSLSP